MPALKHFTARLGAARMASPHEWLASQELGILKGYLTALLLPPVPLIGLVLLGGVAIARRRAWLGWSLLLLACMGLYASTTGSLARFLTQRLLSPPPALSAKTIAALKAAPGQAAGAVVVLGAGREALAPEYGAPSLNRLGLERLRYGIWLSRATAWPLAFSGGVGHGAEGTVDEARIAAHIAQHEFGWPLRWQEGRSRDTRENAQDSVALMKQQGVRRLLLVTHAFHMPRAVRAFEAEIQRQQAPIELLPAPLGLGWIQGEGGWQPSQEGMLQNRWVIREWLGWLAGA